MVLKRKERLRGLHSTNKNGGQGSPSTTPREHIYGLIHKVHALNFLYCCHKRPTQCNNISDPRSEECFELGNSDGHEEGAEGDEEERGEVVEGVGGGLREEIPFIIGLSTMCQARCEDYS